MCDSKQKSSYKHVSDLYPIYYHNWTNISTIYIYRVIQEESARLREMIVRVILSKKVHMNVGPILDGYGVMTA